MCPAHARASGESRQGGAGEGRLIGNPLRFSRTPVSYRSAPPSVGADTEAVLGRRGEEV